MTTNPDPLPPPETGTPPPSDAYDPASYGDTHADAYDLIYANAFPTDLAAARLTELAATRHGPVLDLGIGTGRLAVPLRQAGTEVHGIDASPAMIARLRAQPEAVNIPVWQTDIADFSLPHRYAVIVCAVSTLFMLPDRDTQISCLRCAGRHLQPNGLLVVEAFVPHPLRFDPAGRRLELRHLDDTGLHLVISHHEPAEQTVTITHVFGGPDGLTHYPVTLRYAWPTELDLMATMAGLDVVERIGGWDGRPYTSATTDHITTYRRQPST